VYRTAADQVSALKLIRGIIMNGDVECKPRRDLLMQLDFVTALARAKLVNSPINLLSQSSSRQAQLGR